MEILSLVDIVDPVDPLDPLDPLKPLDPLEPMDLWCNSHRLLLDQSRFNLVFQFLFKNYVSRRSDGLKIWI